MQTEEGRRCEHAYAGISEELLGPWMGRQSPIDGGQPEPVRQVEGRSRDSDDVG